MRKHFDLAVKNIARYGDTDVFPYPIEKHIFFDCHKQVVDLLEEAHKEFMPKSGATDGSYLDMFPPVNAHALAPVGAMGFRWATQLDPFWNAYLLGLAIALAESIEATRVPIDGSSVFSYRFSPDTDDGRLFDPQIGWRQFMEESVRKAAGAKYVLTCDISDFYSRVYHHRLENALQRAAPGSDIPKRIDRMLSSIAGGTSYGLPVGGPAARMLAEAVLNATDQLLRMEGVRFCRFVDDYHIFADSERDAFNHLIFLSEKLLINEGLSLQKSKTRILTSHEFSSMAQLTLGQIDNDGDQPAHQAAAFMKLHIRFDPYADDPEAEYDKIRADLEGFDVVGMLKGELEKSRVHGPLTMRLLTAAKALDDDAVANVARVVVDNVTTLAPVFPHSMVFLKSVLPRLSDEGADYIVERLCDLLSGTQPVTQVSLNRMYAIRTIAYSRNVQTEETLARLFRDGAEAPLLRKDVILVMARWGNTYWLSDLLKRFHSLNAWERRASIVASYVLGDEGKHWRAQLKGRFTPFELLVREWAAQQFHRSGWQVPL